MRKKCLSFVFFVSCYRTLVLAGRNQLKDSVEADQVTFLRLDVRAEPVLKRRFDVMKYPAMYWLENTKDRLKKRYGGAMLKLEIMGFIEDRVGIRRTKDGSLPDDAGRIKEFDQLISENIETIRNARHMDDILIDARVIAEKHKKEELADYYLYLLNTIDEAGNLDAVQEERMTVLKALAHSNDSTRKTNEYLTRKKNILTKIVDEIGKAVYERHRQAQFVKVEDIKERKPYEKKPQSDLFEDDEESEEEEEVKHTREETKIHRHEEL